MAHGVNPLVKREIEIGNKARNESVDGHQVVNPSRMGSRRMFTPQFKLQVLDSYRNDSDCKGNQRATARKYGIHRRQIQKWLQCETNLRSSVVNSCSKAGPSVVNQSQTASSKQTNGEVNFHLALDITRQNVAVTSNKSNTGFLSPVHSHTIDYTPVSYEHIPPSASLPSSPVFTAPIEPQQQQQQHQQQYDEYSVHFVDYVPQLQQQTPSTSIVPPPTHHQHVQQFHENQITYNYESYYYDLSPMPITPIDLSVRSRSRENECCESRTPSPRACVWQNDVESGQSVWQKATDSTDGTHLVELTNVCNKAMDLSCRKRKATDDSDRKTDEWTVKPAKAIKLFKPYLDNDDDDDDDDGKKCKSEQRDPIIWSNYCENYSTYSCSPHQYDCNSNVKESSMYSYSSPPYPTSSTYICCSYGSPVSGYDSASSSYSTSSESGETKRSFDYTIDFKFQPIDNYYYEMSCRGDERAVPHKYCMEIAG
ncbi:uncharacterized protein LOC119076070 [Bradysia coprophila]|uniref:uncharacterized protein LOC119076070 n=1 Tax=Bradysia coprophila TaxID=38358 RepID=UPI00187D90EE|nr:uncharacterized protein LOC119076070 [Bradysia coprophila]